MQRCNVDDDDFDDNDGFDDDDNIDDNIDDDDNKQGVVDDSKPVTGPWARVRGHGPRDKSGARTTRRSSEAREIGRSR